MLTSRELANEQRRKLYARLLELQSIIGIEESKNLATEIENLVRHERNDVHEMHDNAILKIANS